MQRRTFIKTSALAAAALAVSSLDSQAAQLVKSTGNAAQELRPSRGNTVVDFESHYLDPVIFEYMKTRTTAPFYDPETKRYASFGDVPEMVFPADLSNLLELGEKRIADMDRAGINVMYISGTIPLEVSFPEEEATKRMPGVNDRLAEAVARHPERFKAMASLSPHDPEKAALELKRCVTELGMAGWQLHSHFLGNRYPDDPRYLPIWKMAAELEIPVYLHPTGAAIKEMHGFGFPMVGSPFGFAIDASISLVRLVYSGLFEKFPKLKIISAHMGETLPFLVQRMDAQLGTKSGLGLPKSPGEYLRSNVFYSTSGSFSKEVFQCLRSVMGVDRIVFGSDWPYEDLPACTNFVDSLPLTPEEFTKVYSGNAIRELGLS